MFKNANDFEYRTIYSDHGLSQWPILIKWWVFFFFSFWENIQVRLKKDRNQGAGVAVAYWGPGLSTDPRLYMLTLWDGESMAQKVSVTGPRSHS